MDILAEGLVLLIVLGAVAAWQVVIPARDLLRELHRIASGDYRPVMLTGMPRFFQRAAGNLRVTAETLARQRELLAEEEFSLAMILGRMTEGVVITGPDLRIRLVNETAAAMFNLSGKTDGFLLQEVFRSHELLGVARHAAASGNVQRGELTTAIPGRRDRCHMVITAAPLKTAEAKSPDGLLIVLHDISRLRELESVRREFVANVSHEFRTPLSVIYGYLETLEQKGTSREMMRRSIAVMRRHCDRLNRLLEDLLTISRMEEKGVSLEFEPADLGIVLQNVIEQMEREIEKRGVALRLTIPSTLPPADIDVYRMEQAFSNLLANALRHGRSEGGEVDISILVQGTELMVSFRDNGPGIPLHDQEHIFERFYRTGEDRARHTGGTGLGLSIVKNVIQAHGGRIALESKPGAGSTFRVFLPLGSSKG
jgi:two-component system phosphate regulon sensor histidine kinase PhoR